MADGVAPAISVVMSVKNGQDYVREALDSILGQTFSDFECLIVEDGSTDATAAILAGYTDPRIRILPQSNQGLVVSLNRGIAEARAPIIARQDADDASARDRFTRQYALFAADPSLVLAGTCMSVMNTESRITHTHEVLLQDPELKQELLVRSPFAHPSVMFRKEAFFRAGGYRQGEWPGEDYGLWIRLAPFGTFANLDEHLYSYRDNPDGISSRHRDKQVAMEAKLRLRAWESRKDLIPRAITTVLYVGRMRGQLRIERIARNLLSGLRKACVTLDFAIAFKILRLIVSNAQLLREGAGLLMRGAGSPEV